MNWIKGSEQKKDSYCAALFGGQAVRLHSPSGLWSQRKDKQFGSTALRDYGASASCAYLDSIGADIVLDFDENNISVGVELIGLI
ncbi:MAG: hypothetical protein A3C90_01740 [Candidatus Magasanikbacteria bacterium RIFCSPHIGHO2_02_FULL_51_14]|uniref:Uncharacterized protein n=1 Tax=Candidatus Magasanikbacteria bacterium RIFCSPHIGHO2_02_FULL_51_14 TaxID=1798683 RepID=A0A1F6MGF4_9BACT|nr:MAG: hypothetical protein A3C90_01740 [Candidatus Magasanikbacteria bacterium RIFCSPHIGHO2_02_FULL_51_14]